MSKRRPIKKLPKIVLPILVAAVFFVIAVVLSVLAAVGAFFVVLPIIDYYRPAIDYSISDKLDLSIPVGFATLLGLLMDGPKRWPIQELLEVPIQKLLEVALSALKAVRSAVKAAALPVLKAVALSALIAAVLFLIFGKLDLSISIGFAMCIAWITSWLGAQGIKKQTEKLIKDNRRLNKKAEDKLFELSKKTHAMHEDLKQRSYSEIKRSKKGEEPSGEPSPAQALKKALDDADAWFNRDIAIDDADAWLDRGLAKALLGRYEGAIKDFDEVIRLQRDEAIAWTGRGLAEVKLGRYEGAIKDFDEAIRLQSDYVDDWFSRGLAKALLGRYEEAIADLDEAIRLKPDYALAWACRSFAKEALDRYKEALKDLTRAIKLGFKLPQ